MTGITRTISFSDLHYKLVTSLSKTYKLGFSEVVRRLINSGLDHDAALGLSFHEERLKSLQGEVAAVEAMIKEMTAEATTPSKVFAETRTCNSLTSKPRSDLDNFLHHVGNLGCGGKLGELAARKAKEFLEAHPGWSEYVSPEKNRLLVEPEGSQ